MKKELQELKNMITADRYPKMDGSHRLDHSEAIRLIIRLNNKIQSLESELDFERNVFNAINDVYPDQVSEILSEFKTD